MSIVSKFFNQKISRPSPRPSSPQHPSAQHSPKLPSPLPTRRGDTIIEAMIAITIFSVVALLTISIMNTGLARAQVTLEITMARNEIDAQAETIRFIHNAFLSERDFGTASQDYVKLWNALKDTSNVVPPLNDFKNCNEAINNAKSAQNAFIVNSRIIDDRTNTNSIETKNKILLLKNHPTILDVAPLYPRIIYEKNGENSDQKIYENDTGDAPFDQLKIAEGIWVQGVAQQPPSGASADHIPEYYDFHIRTCWNPAGGTVHNTIGTILRLYNPEYSEEGRSVAP